MPLKVPAIKALCFDVDGTLSDTDDLYAQKVSGFFPRFIFKDPDHAARRFVMWIEAPGNALLGLADTLHLDDEMVAVIHWLNRRRKHSDKKFLLVPGVDEMLRQFHGRYPMAVVSARDEKGTMRFLEQYNLAQYFSAVVTGLSATHTKPYPDPILLAAKKMNVAPEHCLMIGDTTVDIRAGKSAGAQTVGVLCGFGEEHELRRFGADEIIENTTGLLNLLKP
ncbi:MAG: HAD family hydrolase [Anaerolineales bacterium]|jgi:HAD superfamily hydrolase (TIGR01509 family)|nr:HAD family hydrolase [Chloroflexota bacterium]MBK6644348.1 HAD family hydrolase [Anaerolineales bacterium]MCC6987247.1 HAD family hydrolase [Anaerolineales bacterium]